MEKIMSYCVLFCQAAHHVLNLKLDILVIRKLQQICSKEKNSLLTSTGHRISKSR